MPDFTLQKATIDDWKIIETIEKTANKKLYAPRKDKAEILHDITKNFIFFIIINNEKIGFVAYVIEPNGDIEFLEYYGIVMFGDTNMLKEFTGKFSLYQ